MAGERWEQASGWDGPAVADARLGSGSGLACLEAGGEHPGLGSELWDLGWASGQWGQGSAWQGLGWASWVLVSVWEPQGQGSASQGPE